MQWFDVDKAGLAKLLERKGKEFVIFELIQNAWDEKTTKVNVTLKRSGNTPYAELMVEDDNPEGFADLKHAFTLFAESSKKSDAEKRGRFNLGEKLVLALCSKAMITSTKGTILFDEQGRRTRRVKTERGSVFTGLIKMTNDEMAACSLAVGHLLPPPGIKTTYNGDVLPERPHASAFSGTLPTEIADEEGILRRSQRKTVIRLYEAGGEQAWLYEMGIPVVEVDGRWHIDIGQKVPLNLDRDNVTPSYLAKVHAMVVEAMRHCLTDEDANATWVKNAIHEEGDMLSEDTIKKIADLRFGEKRVAYDPSDPEANSLAVSKGYTVVHGGQMSKPEWDAMRRSGAIQPAGRVTPSPRPFSPEGKPLSIVPQEKWTQEMFRVAQHARILCGVLLPLKSELQITITKDITWPFAAAYGAGHLILNYGRLGKKWFGGPEVEINKLLIHEYGHHYSSNHLSSEYHDALCDLGARLAEWMANEARAEYAEELAGASL